MRAWVVLVAYADLRGGAGGGACEKTGLALGSSKSVTIDVKGQGARHFDIRMPERFEAGAPALAATLFFHGQYGDPAEQHDEHKGFEQAALADSMITVTPAGANDTAVASNGTKWAYTSWNVGAKHDDRICDAAAVKASGYPACMESCQSCGACDWATCHDDVEFVRSILDYLDANTCLDKSKLFLYGESNGAMLVYHLLQALPGVFAAAVPVQGLPLRGYLPGESPDPAEAAGAALLEAHTVDAGGAPSDATAIMHWAGREDKMMPLDGRTLSEDGFHYASLDETLKRLGVEMGCSTHTPEPIDQPWQDTMYCESHGSCADGNALLACTFQGAHGDLPKLSKRAPDRTYDAMVRWFFAGARQASPQPWRPADTQLRAARPEAVAVGAAGTLERA